ncbi:MAG: MipA/OmpV family protein [Thiogranum sp.]|nr:MipA/OmpV family protein [Thiogranum sp.]
MNEAGSVSNQVAFYVACWLFCTSGVAGARDYPLWEAGAGVGFLSIPDYRGAEEQREYALPIPYLIYRGERLRVDREKVRGLLLETQRWELNISAGAGVPVNSNDNAARKGMPDLHPTVELGPQINITLAGSRDSAYQLDLRLPVRQVWAVDWPGLRSVGRVFSPVLNYDLRNRWLGPRLRLGLQAGPIFADGDYHRYYYQVDPAFSRADRPAYSAGGGYAGSQGTISLSQRFDGYWVGAFVRVSDLHGAVIEDSPLVRQKTNLFGGVAVSRVFGRSAKRVEAEE